MLRYVITIQNDLIFVDTKKCKENKKRLNMKRPKH